MAGLLARIGFPVFDRLLGGRISGSALTGAETAYQRGDRPAASHLLGVVVASKPRDTMQLVRAGALSNALGDAQTAQRLCAQALEREPLNHEALTLQAYLDLTGPSYVELLRRMHAMLRPRTYLETGVVPGKSLRVVGPSTRAIGIDPQPPGEQPLPPNVRLFAMTGDDFFRGSAAKEALAGAPLDLALIGGSHLCEQALQEFIHVERLCTPASTVLIHDCYPLNRATSGRERTSEFWTGDVWRTVVALRRHRPELKIRVVAAPPSGLAVVRGLNPASNALAERYNDIAAEMLAFDYGMLEQDKAGVLGRFPNEWERVASLLRA